MDDELAQTFLDVQVQVWTVVPRDREGLERELRKIAIAGEQTWPGVRLDATKLAYFLAERAPDETDPLDALQAMATTDLYLALGCLERVDAALAHFERQILSRVAPAVARIDASPAFVGEVEDDIRIKMLAPADGSRPRIASYIGRGPLSSWVQVAAIRAAYSKKRLRPKDEVEDVDKLAAFPFEADDAELASIRHELAEPFRRAFETALRSLAPRERNVLRMHVVEGLSTETVGRIYGVHRATVHRWIVRVQGELVSATKRSLARDLSLTPSQLESVVRLIQSQLDFSIASALDP